MDRLSTPQLLDAFFESAVDLLCVADLSGRFRRLNAEWTRTLGYPLDELVGRFFIELVHPEDRASTLRAVQDLAGGKIVAGFVNRYQCKDGTYRWIEWRSAPLGADLIAAAARDVTEARRVEQQLRESEAFLRRTQMMVRLGHWRLDVDTRVVHCSEEVIRIFELPAPTFSFEEYLEAVTPEDRQRVREANERAIRECAPYDIEYRLCFADGMCRYVRSTGEPVTDAGGRLVSLAGTVQDLTERHEAEQERRRFEAQIQQVQKLESLGVLAGGVAHDFNNMLMAILGNVQLALEHLQPGSPARPLLDDVVAVSDRAADLCRQMLAYSGRGRFVVQAVDLSTLIAEMRHILAVSFSKAANVRYSLAPDLPRIEADAAQVRQIVMNLVTNASEALGEGGGTISVSTRRTWVDRELLESIGAPPIDDGRYVQLQVEDTGCGMDERTLGRCFEPFFTTKFTGRGLGLAAVHGIVQSHRGAIGLRSEPGRGTTVTILLPALADAPQTGAAARAASGEWRGSGTVLLADDEETVRTVGRRLLERLGFEVLLAADGREAIELFRARRGHVRCVLLDLTMPGLSGKDAVRGIRQLDGQIPILLCSGYTEEEATSLAGPDVDAFLQKPYRMQSLAEALRRALGG